MTTKVEKAAVAEAEKSPPEASEDRRAKKEAETTATAGAAAPGQVPAARGAQTPLPPPQAAAQPALPQAPPDPEDIDACDVEFVDFTSDEDLPAAQGGVA